MTLSLVRPQNDPSPSAKPTADSCRISIVYRLGKIRAIRCMLGLLYVAVFLFIITSPVGAVAKYCDEHVCVCMCVCVCQCVCLSLCLSARISPEQHTRFLPIFSVHVAGYWTTRGYANSRVPTRELVSSLTGQLTDNADNRKRHYVPLIIFFIVISITNFTRTRQMSKVYVVNV